MLKCENISKIYNDKSWFSKKESIKVLENISFHLKQGRSMGFAGRNGAGKSTLIRIILGLEKAEEGSVIFMDKNIHSLKYNELKNIYKDMQVVFENPQSSMNPQFTVYDVIKEPVENYYSYKLDEIKNIVINLLSAVKLSEDKLYKNIMHLSGGEQQRVAIARALSVRPKLLILDEALSSLDMIIQAEIIKLLEELKEKYNLSYLVISHDIRIILKLCDDIIFLENGKIQGAYNIENGINEENSAFQKMFIF